MISENSRSSQESGSADQQALFPKEACWISDASYAFQSPDSPVPMCFRRRFTAKKVISNLTVTATAIGIFDLYLDGKRLSEEYFNPGFTDYKANLQAVSFTAGNLPAGEHVLLSVVAGGWAVGRSSKIANTNQSRSKLWANRQAFLASAEISYADRSTEQIVSDAEFEVTGDGPWTFADFYDGECYDAGKEAVLRDNTHWRRASLEKLRVSPKISLRCGLPVTAHEAFEAVYVSTTPSGERIYDFGQNFAGVVSFEIDAHEGQKIIIRHAEMLDQGELYVKNLRTAKQILTYICREGKQSFSPRFTYMGFRYIGVRIMSGTDAAAGNSDRDSDVFPPFTISARAIYSDLPETGSFSCSNADLNQLQQNLIRSGKSNFVDIPTDCPQRDERQGWTGDIALFAPTACFNFDMSRFLRKWLLDLKTNQGFFGSIPFVVPKRPGITPSITTSCWGDSCILVPWALYRSEGDPSVLSDMYPVMKRHMADTRRWAVLSLFSNGSPHILRFPFQFGDWCAPEGDLSDWLKKGPEIGTAYYANSCRLMAEIASVLGKLKDARRYRKLYEKVRKAFCRKFTDGHGKMKREFQSAYVLALSFGLLEEVNRKTAADRLLQLLRDKDMHLSTGFSATPHLLFALADNGYPDEAYELLLQDTAPSWLYQIRRGATTTWENWRDRNEKGDLIEGSFNHYAYGAVGDFFYRRICGLEPLEPGYKRFRVKPVPGGGLRYAECTHRCPKGLIRVHWGIREGQFELQVTVPEDTVCEAVLPGGKTEIVEGPGMFTFSTE